MNQKPTPTRNQRREMIRQELHALWPSLPIAKTAGGISLDPRINPLAARIAGSLDQLKEIEARIGKLEAKKKARR